MLQIIQSERAWVRTPLLSNITFFSSCVVLIVHYASILLVYPSQEIYVESFFLSSSFSFHRSYTLVNVRLARINGSSVHALSQTLNANCFCSPDMTLPRSILNARNVGFSSLFILSQKGGMSGGIGNNSDCRL